MNRPVKYTCPKCGATECKVSGIRTSGNIFTSILNIQNRKFSAVICNNCRYTEFYYEPSGRRAEL